MAVELRLAPNLRVGVGRGPLGLARASSQACQRLNLTKWYNWQR